MPKQSSQSVMMVRPKNFGFDHATAASNSFQDESGADAVQEISRRAVVEFDAAVGKLRANEIVVHVIEDTDTPKKPNAVFPNNWVSFHGDKVLLYPMLAENRRLERRPEILEILKGKGLQINEVLDISGAENDGKYLESTGSMVLDYENRLSYACISSRTDKDVLNQFCELIEFKAVVFEAFDKDQVPIYHTNVLMCIGTQYAVICLEAILEDQRGEVTDSLTQTGHEIVPITMDQMYSFAGNMLELVNAKGETMLVMSNTAYMSLMPDQKGALSKYAKLLSVEIPTIEKYGGGSVRCMMCRVT
mgnify:CR=1 FL=1